MLLLKARLALELPPINKALSRAAEGLPPIDGGDELQHPVKKDENGQTVETPTRQRPEQDGQHPKS